MDDYRVAEGNPAGIPIGDGRPDADHLPPPALSKPAATPALPTAVRLPAVAGLALLICAAACGSPAQRFSDRASALGIRAEMAGGDGFQHVVYWKSGRMSRTLHVYIDGDGTPWLAGSPANDPTPRTPLVLDLMALDPHPSIYLGRPCYHGLAQTPPCSSPLWTWERYSEAVVTSMGVVLRRILDKGEFDRVIWFGYSGGGTLAILLAPRFPETAGIVTVAANLDIDAWADLHGYPRLDGSLNPARQPPLPARVYQRHYVGGEDRVVPKEIVARAAIGPDTLRIISSFDHTCCWEEIWPAVLKELEPSEGLGP
jgi:hypothetical protein